MTAGVPAGALRSRRAVRSCACVPGRVRALLRGYAASAAVVLGAGGCSSGVTASPLPAAATAGCAAATAAYPSTVSGLDRRAVSGDPAGVAAWGDPAVIARCGAPTVPPTTTECVEVDGVGWVPQELSDGARFTTFGTDPALEVLVPGRYSPEPLLLPAFTRAATALPRNGRACR